MTEKLVTVATYFFGHEAHFARTVLESRDIWAVVANEHSSRLSPFTIHGVGGVKLQVRESDFERAAELLQELESAEVLPPEDPPPDPPEPIG